MLTVKQWSSFWYYTSTWRVKAKCISAPGDLHTGVLTPPFFAGWKHLGSLALWTPRLSAVSKEKLGQFRELRKTSKKHLLAFLGGGFKHFFIFTPIWGNDPI